MTTISSLETLETPRLHLRPFAPTDAPDVQRIAGDARVAESTLLPHPYPEGAAEAWLATHSKHILERTAFIWAITQRDTRELIGCIGLHGDAERGMELGYWLDVPHWGQGIATEAAQRVLEHGFTVLGLHRVFARYFSTHPASGRVMEKLGMRRVGILEQAELRFGQHKDLVIHELLRRDWLEGERGPA